MSTIRFVQRPQASPWRLAGWGTVGAILLLPALAMQVTDEVDWDAEDFVFAAIMLGGVGLAFEMAVRATGSWAYRAGAAIALCVGLVTLWVNGAVGIAGDEGDPIDLWFNLVPLLALLGSIGAQFRAAGLSVAMRATGVCQIAVGAILQLLGYFTWPFIVVSTGGWLVAAYLFGKAADPENPGRGFLEAAPPNGPAERSSTVDADPRPGPMRDKASACLSGAFLETAMARFERVHAGPAITPEAVDGALVALEITAQRSGVAFSLRAAERTRLAFQFAAWLGAEDRDRARTLIRNSLALMVVR